MKITKRSKKYSVWYETIYWPKGQYRVYQTKTLSEHHNVIHEQAKAAGYKAETTMYERLYPWPGVSGKLIRTTK